MISFIAKLSIHSIVQKLTFLNNTVTLKEMFRALIMSQRQCYKIDTQEFSSIDKMCLIFNCPQFFRQQGLINNNIYIMGCFNSKIKKREGKQNTKQFTCPLNHVLDQIQQGSPQKCQICSVKSVFYFHCERCSYHACLSHFQHRQFCPNVQFQCLEIGFQQIVSKGRCMICFHSDKRPGIKCANCSLRICMYCKTIKHTDFRNTLQLCYFSKESRSKCFDCGKQITGGLSCKNCTGSFCQSCQKDYLLPQQNQFILLETKDCSICLQIITKGEIKLTCNHSFHGKCLATWNNRTCPNCRSAF